MKKFMKKVLIYLVLTMLIFPASAVTMTMRAQKVEAADSNEGKNILIGWDFEKQTAIATSGIVANQNSVLTTNADSGDITYMQGSEGANTYSAAVTGWNGGSVSKYWKITFSTAGYKSLTLSSKQRSTSTTGPRDFKVQYELSNSGQWEDIADSPIIVKDNFTSGILNDLILPDDLSNQQIVSLRWIMTSETSVNGETVASTGSSRIDDILITGSKIGNVYNQTTGVDYITIQDAVDAATDGDRIVIQGGEYHENLIIVKPIQLVGMNKVIIDSVTLNSVDVSSVNVEAKNVNVIAPASIQTGVDIVTAKVDQNDPNGNVMVWQTANKDQYIGNITLDKNIALFSPNFLPIVGLSDSTGQNLPTITPLDNSKPGLTINSDAMVSGLRFEGIDAIQINSGFVPKISSNVFANSGLSIKKLGVENIGAESNYWGSADEPNTKVSGNVSYSPWYTDTTFASLKFKLVDGVLLTKTAVAEQNYINGHQVILDIPAGTQIAGENWDGVLNVGKVTEFNLVNLVLPGEVVQNATVVEIGAGNQGLALTGGSASITFIGQAQIQHVGYWKDEKFIEINTSCIGEESNQIPEGSQECKAVVDNDLIIVTNHFTQFVSFDSTVIKPTITAVSGSSKDNKNFINIKFEDTGASSYEFFIDGIMASPTKTTSNTAMINITKTGNHSVKMRAVVGEDKSDFSNELTVTIAEVLPEVTTASQTTVQNVNLTPAPNKAKAAANPEPSTQQQVQTPSDNDGVIKGDEKKDENTSATNWTPWIILFILIVFAGAATGGYFYWFAGKEDEIDKESPSEIKPKEQEKVSVTVRPKQKPNKKSKRW